MLIITQYLGTYNIILDAYTFELDVVKALSVLRYIEIVDNGCDRPPPLPLVHESHAKSHCYRSTE